MARRALLIASLVLGLLPAAQAADQTVLGHLLLVKNPSTPEKRAVTIKAREPDTDAILLGNPVVEGATVTVTLDGPTPSDDAFILPAGISPLTGKPFWSGDAAKGFTYRDPKGENASRPGWVRKRSGSKRSGSGNTAGSRWLSRTQSRSIHLAGTTNPSIAIGARTRR